MKRIILLTTIWFCISYVSYGQAVVSGDGGIIYVNKNFTSNDALEGKRGGYFGDHPLGDSVRLAYDKFLKLYVKYESSGGAYATEKKIIYKKGIYDSVSKFDRFFKKQVRTKTMTVDEAKSRMGAILNAAISIRFYDTTQFENIISTTKNLERKEYFFNNIKYIEKKN